MTTETIQPTEDQKTIIGHLFETDMLALDLITYLVEHLDIVGYQKLLGDAKKHDQEIFKRGSEDEEDGKSVYFTLAGSYDFYVKQSGPGHRGALWWVPCINKRLMKDD